MVAKLSENQWADRVSKSLEKSGHKFLGWNGEFIGSRGSALYECKIHGVMHGVVKNIVSLGSGCRKCGKINLPQTQKRPEQSARRAVSSHLESIGHIFLGWGDGGYKGTLSKCKVKCSDHGEWQASYDSLIRTKNGCPSCKSEAVGLARRKNKYDVLAEINANVGHLVFLGWVGEYTGRQSSIKLLCKDHGEWITSPSVLVDQKSTCPGCAIGGGYKNDQPGYLYALASVCGKHVKVGITNQLQKRIKQLKRSTPFQFQVIGFSVFKDGRLAQSLEKECHQKHENSGFAGFNGSTEWLKSSHSFMRWLGDNVLGSNDNETTYNL